MVKSLHEGHRARVKTAVDKDPELESFSEYEVLEYLLGFLIPRKDVNPIAHELIEAFGSLFGVFSAMPEELFAVQGMTRSASHLLPNITAIVRRSELSRVKKSKVMTKVSDAVDFLKPYFMCRDHERMYLMAMDINDRLLQITLISSGIVDYTPVDINKIVSVVSRSQAKKIILAHNHPGGTLSPSSTDLAATRTIATLLVGMGRVLADHIIFTDEGYYSFYQHDDLDSTIKQYDKYFGTDMYKESFAYKQKGKYVLEDKNYSDIKAIDDSSSEEPL